ncbi:MAG: hypothetical protein ACLUD9_03580 [Anaerotignum faecicola]
MSCRVCFEQNNGIDGDSASSTELYCILSSLAELPIRQIGGDGFCQPEGEIQAIGGVTHKIEGFFDQQKACLTGPGGSIPVSNVKDLVLKDGGAGSEGRSVPYLSISKIDEGINDCGAVRRKEE